MAFVRVGSTLGPPPKTPVAAATCQRGDPQLEQCGVTAAPLDERQRCAEKKRAVKSAGEDHLRPNDHDEHGGVEERPLTLRRWRGKNLTIH